LESDDIQSVILDFYPRWRGHPTDEWFNVVLPEASRSLVLVSLCMGGYFPDRPKCQLVNISDLGQV